MTDTAAGLRRGLPLAAGFVGVHVLLSVLNVVGPNQPAGDVTGVYRFWIDYWRTSGVLVGVDTDWVYPIAASVPMIVAGVLGDEAYLAVWLVLVAVLDAVALVLLARRSTAVAWWWLASTALLGPVALSRIDAVACALAVIGVLSLASRPAVAAVLLTVAAWTKVWPAALIAAVLVARRRIAATIAAAALTSAAIVVLGLIAGAGTTLLSFIAAQATRGVQVEAPIALPWLWSAALGDPGVSVYYDTAILTFQVRGQGVAEAAAAMTPVLAVGALTVTVLALLARRRAAAPEELVAVAGLGYVAAVIALNKVGSPQYLTWYVAPLVLGLLVSPRRFRLPAAMALAAAGLTQLVYPWCYGGVVAAAPWAVALLTLRNALEVALLVWALLALRGLRAAVPTVPPPPSAVRARNAADAPGT